jgi:hypothetical protein
LVSRLLWEQEIAGSNPAHSTLYNLQSNKSMGLKMAFDVGCRSVMCHPPSEEALKSGQKTNEDNTSIADEASEWLATQSLVTV